MRRFNQLFEKSLLGKGDVVFRAHPRARNYLAKVDREGRILLTVPRSGTQREALAFANSHRGWLETEREKALKTLEQAPSSRLHAGDWIWFRGEKTFLTVEKDWGRPLLRFGDQKLFIADEAMDLSLPLLKRLRELAKRDLPSRLKELAAQTELKVAKISIRDQRTRWGSCSTSGNISLNWRLILTPAAVRDYIIFHELVHLIHFNHSPQFWSAVESFCPEYRDHEAWLKIHQDELSRVRA